MPAIPVDPVSLPAVTCPILPTPLPAAHGATTKAVKSERHSSEDERRPVPCLQEPSLLPQGEEDPHGLFRPTLQHNGTSAINNETIHVHVQIDEKINLHQ